MIALRRARPGLWRPRRYRVTILDRYVVAELMGPLLFGVAAFTLIFVATQLLAIGRLVSEEHAPLLAAIEYFLWDMPQFLLYVVPMAMLLGTLLAMQRLSSESEITAMLAGGISLGRILVPLATLGLLVSGAALLVQEQVVPLANERAYAIRQTAIEHLSPLASQNLTVDTRLPGGGKQVTIAGAFDPQAQSLLNVTVVRYDDQDRLQEMIVSREARYDPPTWTFQDATTYQFSAGVVTATLTSPTLAVDIGEQPGQLAKAGPPITDPENMSRAQIAAALDGGVVSDAQRRIFAATYAAKLARPFASFVFVLIALPLGLRRVRGGRGVGFGVAVAIVFVYYVIATLALSIGSLALPLAGIAAWSPNALFSLIGLWLLQRASAV